MKPSLFATILFLFAMSLQYVYAQQDIIGRITDLETKKPIKEAIIKIEGTDVKATTNVLGYFQLLLDTTNYLVIESQGYSTIRIKVPSLGKFQVQLEKSTPETHVENEYEKGIIRDGYKIGVWDYYDIPGELSLQIDYTSGKILYIKKDSDVVYTIENNDVWTQSTVDIQPRYIGSMVEYKKIFNAKVRFPAQARRNLTDGSFYVTFEVDTTGQAGNFLVVNDIGDGCGEAAIQALKLIPNLWTVASKNNVKYKSRFIIPITFKFITDEKKVVGNTKKENTLKELPMARKLEEMIVTALGISRKE